MTGSARRLVKRPETIKSPDLRSYLESNKTVYRVLTPLETHLRKVSETDERGTAYGVLHASEIIKSDWCHRYSYHLLRGETPKSQSTNMRSETIFGHGHITHSKYQGWFRDMGLLYGEWKCLACKSRWWAQSPTECPTCQAPWYAIKYLEVPIVNENYMIASRADLWINGIGDPILGEIKTVGKGTVRKMAPHLLEEVDDDIHKAWANIKRPFTDHIKQLQIYAHMLYLEVGKDAPKDLLFIYEFKDNNQPKEYFVKRSTRSIDDVLEAAEMVAIAVKSGIEPRCNVNSDKGTCKSCAQFVED